MSLQAFMSAMRSVESGGGVPGRANYSAIGPSTKYGTAKGAYQFIDSTWGGYGGYSRADQAPPQVQDQRAAQLMSQYYKQFGSWEMVAVAWHGGPGAAQRAQRTGRITGSDVNMSTQNYVNKVMGIMGSGGGGAGGAGNMSMIAGGAGPAMRGATGGGSVIGDLGFNRPMSTAEAKEKAKELYGYLGWFLDHPEVGPLLVQGAKEGWGPERLQGALVKTRWWQKNSEQSRQWESLLRSDPATAKRRLNETGLSIRGQANKLGIWGMGPNRLFEISTAALRHGWNEQEVGLALASEMKWRPGTSTSEQGAIGDLMRGVRKQAADAMVPVTRKQEWEWARRIVSGQADPEAVASQFQKLAKQRFPHLADEIDSGITPREFFQPYQNVIAQELEVNPESVDLMSSKWRQVTSFKDSKTSKVRPMTMSEASLLARRQPEWMKTRGAHEQVGQAASQIGSLFGTR